MKMLTGAMAVWLSAEVEMERIFDLDFQLIADAVLTIIALFFLFMSFAALTTVIAVFQNLISFFTDLFGWSTKKAVIVNMVLVLVLSIPCVLGFNVWSSIAPLGEGSTIQDLEDFIISNNLLPLGSLGYLLFCTTRYGWGWDKFIAEADAGKGIKFPKWARFYVTYILPIIVLFIFVMGYIQKFA